MASEPKVTDLQKDGKYQPILEGAPQTCGMRSGRVRLEKGETCGEHSTKSHEETLVFLAGSGQALLGEDRKPYEVGEGKVCYIPPHTLHDIKNTGKTPLVYIFCVAPVQEELEDKQ
ncbi:glucose-6-phosphate isomerase [Sedimentisphaera cyanobacteriorum]|uniref:Glucose-6-phosphate isomerase n=1 Tax=Sedimentisphaera cyanobacteriorum TaxID=1940790 RepID=A0A1Q2HQB9_9BACT|nr:cupin domain-containing protein [Sedimentisphaera cyanobacteriorum]AQQ09659.1 glucose-6-phosphate isomerase [Sedimentisphaera cyanobacteriorum]